VSFFFFISSASCRDDGLNGGNRHFLAGSSSSSQLSKVDPICGFFLLMTTPLSFVVAQSPNRLASFLRFLYERWQSGNCLSRRRKGASFLPMNELVFEITQESDGGFVAEALGESIITQADTWEELRVNVREAVKAFYFDRPAPLRLRLHLVRDEVIA
jgi:hypothetical protein